METNQPRDPHLWKQAKARAGFKSHLRTYVLVIAGLWLLWAFSTGFFSNPSNARAVVPWPLFVMIGWGIGLVSHYAAAYRGMDEKRAAEREYEKLINRQR